MRVLVLSQFFTPEIVAASVRVETFARGLVEAGHEVDVICEVPNHPQGAVDPAYRGRPLVRRRHGHLRVRHVWVKATPVKTTRARLAFYGSFAMTATITGAVARRPDVVLASSPPLPVGAAAALLAARHRAPWVLDVRDLWPEAAVLLGELRDAGARRAAEWLERRLYRDADAIVTVTEPFRRAIAGRAPAAARIDVLPNGTTRLWLDGAGLEVERRELALPAAPFLWTYAGNVGLAQGLETAIEAAARLDGDTQLLVLGEGPARAELERRAARLAPGGVIFRDLVPPAEAVRHLRASDALLVPLAASPGLEQFVPSKLFDCCAVGRPVIVAAAGEAARLAGDAGAALVVPPGDSAALAVAVRRLRADAALRDRLAAAGRRFAAGHTRDAQVARLVALLEAVAAAPGRRHRRRGAS